jgi:putative ABC transport system ATP-binding protein
MTEAAISRGTVVHGAAAIVAENVEKAFGDGQLRKTILHRVDLALQAGQITLLMGPSGSGKSTLLAILSGLLAPDGGVVRVLGHDLWNLTDSQRERFRLEHCGFIFQGFNLFSALTALQQVELVLEYVGIKGEHCVSRAMAVLELVGLRDRLHLRPQELSGGEKQRVAIARALAKEPRLIFADEPTAALDKANGEVIVSLLRRAAHEQGACVFCVTHDPKLIAYSDRILRIEDGRLVDDGYPRTNRTAT